MAFPAKKHYNKAHRAQVNVGDCAPLRTFTEINNPQSLFPRVIDRVRRAAGLTGQITNANTAVVG